MTSKNLNITNQVSEFVKELNGRYRKHVSDEFLEPLLIHLIKEQYNYEKERRPAEEPEITGLVYIATFQIFESILEYQCNAGGNGHHVAQNLASKFFENDKTS